MLLTSFAYFLCVFVTFRAQIPVAYLTRVNIHSLIIGENLQLANYKLSVWYNNKLGYQTNKISRVQCVLQIASQLIIPFNVKP